jgi:hypothetical protein
VKLASAAQQEVVLITTSARMATRNMRFRGMKRLICGILEICTGRSGKFMNVVFYHLFQKGNADTFRMIGGP